MFNIKGFEAELTRIAIFSVAMEIIALILFFWVLYLVIKCAIRDGINESKLGARRMAESKPTRIEDLPPMRAER
jgi:hypothetical protein